jgi:hypothetical protein
MAKRETYMSDMKARLTQMVSSVDALKAKAGDHVKAEYKKRLDEWKAGAHALSAKLVELKAADDKWYLIKAELEKAARAIEAALGQADASKAEGTPADKPNAPPSPIVDRNETESTPASAKPSQTA